MNPLNHAKKRINEFLKSNSVKYEKIDVSSKNEILKVTFEKKEFVLKIYKTNERGYINEHLQGFDRETFALTSFSKIKEVPKIILKHRDKEFAWYLRDYFDGKPLREFKDKKLYKKAINLMVKLHSQSKFSKKPNKKEIIKAYEEKVQEARMRLKKFLPKKYYDKDLFQILDNFHLCYNIILKNSNKIIHGDFVNRNILVKNNELKLIDWENSRFAPTVEDLIFFVSELKEDDLVNKELIDYYNKKMNTNYPNKIYYILDLFMEYRGLGTLLRIKHNELEKYSERTKNKIIKIKHYAELLNKKYKLKLLVN
tara:strand:- start:128 stop:1060 length:933 start_codon:yes stop_codon:yes gene_type:complete